MLCNFVAFGSSLCKYIRECAFTCSGLSESYARWLIGILFYLEICNNLLEINYIHNILYIDADKHVFFSNNHVNTVGERKIYPLHLIIEQSNITIFTCLSFVVQAEGRRGTCTCAALYQSIESGPPYLGRCLLHKQFIVHVMHTGTLIAWLALSHICCFYRPVLSVFNMVKSKSVLHTQQLCCQHTVSILYP